jgi:hypothetical protein
MEQGCDCQHAHSSKKPRANAGGNVEDHICLGLVVKADTCVICLGKLKVGQENVRLPCLFHQFHRKCLQPCLDRPDPACPTCRTPIVATRPHVI